MSEQTPETDPEVGVDVETEPEPAAPPAYTQPRDDVDRVELYLDDGGKVRWRFRAAGNSAVMGGPQDGLADLGTALANARRVVGRDLVFADREASADGREIKAYALDGLEPPELFTLPLEQPEV